MQSINDYGAQIAQLNVTISQATAQNQQANDLMDRRDVLIDKLSALANVSVVNKSDGTVNVAIGTSDLVVGTDHFTLTQSGMAARGDLQSGELSGVLQAKSAVNGYLTDLDNLASATIQQVNAVHAGGVGADGITYPGGAGLDGSTGVAFFTGTDAQTIGVNAVLVANPQKLAAAAIPAPPAAAGAAPPPGDASNANTLAAIENTFLTSGPLNGQTLGGFYQNVVSNAGAKSASAKTASDSAQANLTQLTQQRSSVSGVSTDTEMVNMMKYQRAYEASARVVTTMDSMLNTLINGLFPAGG
jgi:flagellar hook-associated protein 1 FlgK